MGNKITLSIFILIFSSCAMMTPKGPKKLKMKHKGKATKTIAQYRRVFDNHDWEVEKSDGAGGFLEATKAHEVSTPFGKAIMGIGKVTVSCAEVENKTVCTTRFKSCQNTVPISGCSKKVVEPNERWVITEELFNDLLNLGRRIIKKRKTASKKK